TPQFAMGPNDYVSLDASGLPVITRFLGEYSYGDTPLGGNYTPDQALAKLGMGPPSAAHLTGILQQAGLSPAVSHKLGATLSAHAGPSIGVASASNSVNMMSLVVGERLQVPIGEMMLEAQMAAQVAEAQLAGDAQAIASYNDAIRGVNRQARQVLAGAV